MNVNVVRRAINESLLSVVSDKNGEKRANEI